MRSRTLAQYIPLPASAALMLLAGCASSGSGGGPAATSAPNTASPLRVIQAAYTTTTSARTAHTAVSFNISLSGKRALGGLTMNGVQDFGQQNADETVSDAGQSSGLRILGDDVYLQIPKESDVVPSFPLPAIHKPWVHIRIPDAAKAHGASLAGIFGGSGPDPTQFVKLLTDVSSSVQRVGSDVVRGQQSTHYRLTFDAAATEKLNQAMDACADSASPSKVVTPVDVWVDGSGRLTRMTVSEKAPLPSPSDFGKQLPSSLPTDWPSQLPGGWPSGLPTNLPTAYPTQIFGSGGDLTVSLSMDLYDYGAPVHISPPLADQTQTIPFTPAMLDGQAVNDCPTR